MACTKMRRYPANGHSRIKWTQFRIIVPNETEKRQVQEALSYLHDRDIDTDYITVNQLVHEYEHGDESDKHSRIIIDPVLYKKLQKQDPVIP